MYVIKWVITLAIFILLLNVSIYKLISNYNLNKTNQVTPEATIMTKDINLDIDSYMAFKSSNKTNSVGTVSNGLLEYLNSVWTLLSIIATAFIHAIITRLINNIFDRKNKKT